jgi:hypothetical protein
MTLTALVLDTAADVDGVAVAIVDGTISVTKIVKVKISLLIVGSSR